jgi:Fe2+ transport system protein FeoA
MNSSFAMDLAAMPEGVPARIARVEGGTADLERLEVLGLCAGRTVEVVQAGDPLIVRVLGTRIGLAAALARGIHVITEYGG